MTNPQPPQDKDKFVDSVYGPMIYSLLAEMNGSLMAQVRQVNNSIANIQKIIIEQNETMRIFIASFADSREKRYQEEIDIREAERAQLRVKLEQLEKDIENKKSAKEVISTSDIAKVVERELNTKELEQARHNKIDWVDVRNKAIMVVMTFILTYLLAHYILK